MVACNGVVVIDVASADGELVRRAVGGNETAFDVLVRRHTPRMYRVALRIVGNPLDAEDALQDAWVSAWRALPHYRGESAVSTWLYRIVTNAALVLLRHRKPTLPLDAHCVSDRSRRSRFDAAPLDVVDERADPERDVIDSEQVDVALDAIASLELSQRVPLVLHELEGLTYEEVAEVLGVSVPALRSRLHRARVALLDRLKERQ
ncbi:RNA polymerase sigma factor [Haloechinothrix halophila]|uniref:RNA polymerase sigma factor n=1 Tax=Haloechinothrix halophila TaxID=1069073 RepID=UPI0006864026|nr:sigma-70 family RNA polymerase sigma factor [Haloechinothrix halophila]